MPLSVVLLNFLSEIVFAIAGKNLNSLMTEAQINGRSANGLVSIMITDSVMKELKVITFRMFLYVVSML